LCGKVNGKVDVFTGSAVSIVHARGVHVPAQVPLAVYYIRPPGR